MSVLYKLFRKFYVAGIFSAFILPVLFIINARKELASLDTNCKTVFLIDWEFLNKMEMVGIDSISYLLNRKFLEISFNGNKTEDKTKLDFAQIFIRECIQANDTINGLSLSFGNNATFDYFVKALDVLAIEGAKYYVFQDNNKIKFYNLPQKAVAIDTIQTFVCGFSGNFNEQSKWDLFKDKVLLIWGNSWQFILSFLAFLLCVVFIRIRF